MAAKRAHTRIACSDVIFMRALIAAISNAVHMCSTRATIAAGSIAGRRVANAVRRCPDIVSLPNRASDSAMQVSAETPCWGDTHAPAIAAAALQQRYCRHREHAQKNGPRSVFMLHSLHCGNTDTCAALDHCLIRNNEDPSERSIAVQGPKLFPRTWGQCCQAVLLATNGRLRNLCRVRSGNIRPLTSKINCASSASTTGRLELQCPRR